MSLKDRITDDMKDAMRQKDASRLLTIRGLLAAMKQREVDERIVLDDAAIVAIIDKLVKQRKDSITQFSAGQRQDLVAKEEAEQKILEAYLPQRLDAQASGRGRRDRRRDRRQRALRHGSRHGRGQGASGGSGRHGDGLCRRQAGPDPLNSNFQLPPPTMPTPSVQRLTADVSVPATRSCRDGLGRPGRLSQRHQQPSRSRRRRRTADHAAMESAARAAGLEYAFLPVSPAFQSPEDIARFAELLQQMPKPILAFCRSGTRSGRLFQAATGG